MEPGTVNAVYEVTEKTVLSRYFGEAPVYGIKGSDPLTGETFEMEGVSYDRSFAERLALLLTERKVSVLHAGDVVRDIAAEALAV